MADTALVERSDTQTAPDLPIRLTKRRSGLSPADLGLMLKMAKEGKTQAEIGQRFNLHQTYISKVLLQFQDSTETAKSYLRASALPMARNIVKKGRAADHVVALKGLGVLEEQQQSGLVVQIGGGSNVQVNVQLGPGNGTRQFESPHGERSS